MRSFARLAIAALCVVAASSVLLAADVPLVSRGDTWRYHKGNTPLQLDWKTIADASLNATWLTGPGGFGYSSDNAGETNQCLTILGDMRNTYTTVQMRRTFTISADVDANLHLQLTMDFDDGFIAWLDGAYLTSANVNAAPNDPATNATASASHESSQGNSGSNPQPPVVYDLGVVGSRLGIGTHVLAIIGLNQSSVSSDLIQIADLALVDAGACPANRICSDTNWTLANSPYVVTSTLTVASGTTLTIEPGVTVRFAQGAGINVEGRLLAEGDSTNRIVFTRNTGATSWSTVDFTGAGITNRVAFADFAYSSGNIDANGTAMHLDSLWFTNTTAQLVDLVGSSVTLLNSFIPGGNGVEPIHFSSFPANGHALIKGCTFAPPNGYNDSVDFTGGNRPGPIAQFIDNIFLGAVDDCFDMDGTDAHIEGNIFFNVRKDAARASSSNPITTGADGGNLSQLVICRNIFVNGEHMFLEKDHGMALMQNNTVYRLTPNPLSNNTSAGGNEAPGIILFGEPWRGDPFGDGAIFEGNIGADLQVADLFPLLAQAQAANAGFFFIRNQNCLQGFNTPGIGNINADPLFVGTNITPANVLQMLSLQAGSPCIGTGPNGIDMGALVPAGASISGEPSSPTTNRNATLKIAGPGIWAYSWRLNDGPWSAEVSLVPQSIWNGQPFTAGMFSNAPPITLTNLADGDYTVEVIGRNSAGFWQSTNSPAVSKTWSVQSSAPPPQIQSADRNGDTVTLTFVATAGQTYSVLYRDAFDAAHPWLNLTNVPAPSASGPLTVTDTGATPATRFYQIVTPAQ